jgi:hypothetical protein
MPTTAQFVNSVHTPPAHDIVQHSSSDPQTSPGGRHA